MGDLLARIDSRELTEWAAYEQVCGPLGPVRGDYNAAVVAATVHNAMAGKKGRRTKLKEFMIDWGARRAQTWEEQLAAVRVMNRAMGGRDLTRTGKGAAGGDPDQPRRQAARRHR